jgi:hypothetical protein
MNHSFPHAQVFDLASARTPKDPPALAFLFEASEELYSKLPPPPCWRLTHGDLGHPLETALRVAIDQLYDASREFGIHELPPALAHHLGYWLAIAGRYAEAWPAFRAVAGHLPSSDAAYIAALGNWRLLALAAQDWDAALAALELFAGAAPEQCPFPIDQFIPLRVLGVGGYAELYLCRHIESRELVVVKVYSRSNRPQWPRDVFHEANLLSLVNHPAIPEVRQRGYVDDALQRGPYCVLDFFDGLSLHAYVQRYGPLSPNNVRHVLMSVLAAISAVHEAGLLHCDIKPGNVLLRLDGHGWHTQLIDFGIGVRLDDQTNGAAPDERRPGTLGFAAPEQLGHLFTTPLTTAADVYALGQTALFALTGLGPTQREREQHLQRGEPLVAMLVDCISSDPRQRPRVSQLQRYLAQLELTSPPSLPPEHPSTRWPRD